MNRRHLMLMALLLWSSVWLCGFIMLTISLHADQYHSNNPDANRSLPSITIFSAPRPFDPSAPGLLAARQELAVRSWLAVSPGIDVVLFGKHPSLLALAALLGPRVRVEPAIDLTFLGTPFFHSMVARSQASHSGISVLIDPETIFLPDLITTLYHAYKLDRDWFMVSKSRNISLFPFHLDDTGKQWLQENGEKINPEKLQDFLRKHHSICGERLLMAWNKGVTPLHAGILPPFLYGKGSHNEWLTNEVLSSKFRFTFDASEVISSYYPQSLGQQYHKFIKDFDNGDERIWEHTGNHYLATVYGSLYFQANSTWNNLTKLVKCSGKYVFINPMKSTIYHQQELVGHGYNSLKPYQGQNQDKSHMLTRFMLSKRDEKWKSCVKDTYLMNTKSKCSIMDFYEVSSKTSMPLLFPFSLESLLQLVVDKDKSIVLAVAGDNYRDMLMSWVCRLRQLEVTNFVVCALDPGIFKFSVLQGLPVFKDPLAPTNISFSDCHFGTECFQRVTKVKSRVVLQILKLGYNVLMSDVDVYWFDNPLPFLNSFGPATLLAQSDEYNETVPINLPRRLNSGFYFAHSDPATIAAMERVVKHASTSGLSEQPSFYDVLCGEGGVNRMGDDRCLEPNTNLTVLFLDRDRFPNGAYKGLWETHHVKSACKKQGCLVIHNNWISGRKRKLERQLHSGLWEYDSASRQCLQSWHRSEP